MKKRCSRKVYTLPCSAGVLQFDVKQGDYGQNLIRVEQMIGELGPLPGGLLVLPELWATGFAYDRLDDQALQTPVMLDALAMLAKKNDIIFAGTLIEKGEYSGAEVYYNSLFVVGAQGVHGVYRKQHLFVPMEEERFFVAGSNPLPITTPLGIVAALVCYDLRFADLASRQCARGAGVILVSAQWPEVRLDHWQTLLKARAIENQVFVVAANRCGATNGVDFAGHSTVIAPDGKILLEFGRSEQVGAVMLDQEILLRTRNSFNTIARTPYRFADLGKIMDLVALERELRTLRAVGKKIVFTNGCFDILHQGHVSYLEEARKQGDCLVVGLNSDDSIRAIKGPDRPVNHQGSRARVLAALGAVDYVVVFSQDTPLELITAIMPDILVKGADWRVADIVGASEVIAAGGEVINVPLVPEYSTTAIIRKIADGS